MCVVCTANASFPKPGSRADMPIPVSFIEIRALSHATENVEKVLAALKQVITDEVFQETSLTHEKLEGHYGNPITLIKTKIYKKSQARKIVQNIFSRLDETGREILSAEVEKRVDDEGCLYVRIDKQAAYNGTVRLTNADPIRLQIKLAIPSRQRERVIEAYRKMISKG